MQMLTIHYYLLFDGPDDGEWQHMKSFYNEGSAFRFVKICLS